MNYGLLSVSFAFLAFACKPSNAGAQDVWTEAELARVSSEVTRDVERIRGKKFVRPVTMKITDKAGFVAHAKERMGKMLPADHFSNNELMAKMLNLIPADMDLLKTTMDVLEEQVGGFYVPEEDTFYIMDAFVGPVAKIILAHELTHALDDQLYDIDDDMRERATDSDMGTAYSAVVEGSGTLAMNRYTVENMRDFDAESLQAASSMGTEAMASAPAYVWQPLLACYLRGSTFLIRTTQMLQTQLKDASADDLQQAFTKPPLSTEQILHPEKYWDPAQRDDPKRVQFDLSGLPAGYTALYQDTLGEMHLALVTRPAATRSGFDAENPLAVMGLKYTHAAVAGWGGDRLLILAKGAGRVLRLVSVWDSAQDAAEFYGALTVISPEIEENLAALAAAKGDKHSDLRLAYGAGTNEVVLDVAYGLRKSQLEDVLESLKHTVE